MKKIFFCVVVSFIVTSLNAQVKWKNFDSLYQPLPASMHIYKSTELLDSKPNIMYYAIVDVSDKGLRFTADTAWKRRLTPTRFYQKNNAPLLVVNCSFFSFATNQNLNAVIKNGKIISYNKQTQEGRGKDTLTYLHSFLGALGVTKKRKIDIAWTFTDSSKRNIYASQYPVHFFKDSVEDINLKYINKRVPRSAKFSRWDVKTAIGGGPVLVQNNEMKISNNEENKFAGNAALNHEPRTAVGYTKDNKLVILVCEGRSDSAAGLTLIQLAKILKDIGCVEALNLDGGGSTCMLINGKETNTPSGKGVQRPVPSVFLIERNK